MTERILLVGSGGREHALAWALSKSPSVSKVFVAPGNAGTASGEKVSNIALDLKDFKNVLHWCQENGITFVVVGPEDPLADGIVDYFSQNSAIPAFGPTAAAAQIEADKSFAKHFMVRHGIPTARFQSFRDADEACNYITSAEFDALVVKASGLAAGKGVVVATSKQQACEAVKEMINSKVFGSAGEVVVVEELLKGPEVSLLAFTDGETVALMPPAQDHKRLEDNDEGPNTGGMGAVCPYPWISQSELDNIKTAVLEKTVKGMAAEGNKYIGVLYAGLMLTKDGPKVLEFNCRFGDPETQSILSLLKSDLLSTLKACVNGTLQQAPPVFDTSVTATGVVVVSGGYPGSYRKGLKISGISEVESCGLRVFHAGTTVDAEGNAVTSGGRVLAVVAVEPTLKAAAQKATEGAGLIQFDGAFHRKDIGAKILNRPEINAGWASGSRDETSEGLQYKDAGVDIEAGDYLVQVIKPLAKMTRRSGCDADLGGFGGVFDLAKAGMSNCVITCRTRGVGRKIKFAEKRGHHYNIGFDLVAECVNDLLVHGAEPLFFLDYYATGKLHVPAAEEVVRGIADGCLQAGCALVGGETAEMPGMYRGNDYDVAGIAVGAIPHSRLLLHQQVAVGDAVIALTSSGLQHDDFVVLEEVLLSYSLNLHKLKGVNGGATLAEEILIPSSIYVKSVLPLIYAGKVKGFTSVTEGLSKCLQRILPAGMGARLDAHSWHIGPVFGWLSQMARLSADALVNSCSCGVAAVMIVPALDAESTIRTLSQQLVDPVKVIGHVVEHTGDSGKVIVANLSTAIEAGQASAYSTAPENFERLSEQVSVAHIPSLFSSPDLTSVLDLALRPGAVLHKESQPPTFDLNELKLSNPVLVSGTDGVGTKLKIAQALNHHSTIGIDLVAMCVNDILASGADPLFFTSYLALGKPDSDLMEVVLRGVATGCQMAGCALIEHHVSVLPSIYLGNIYDLGGFSVGVVERSQILPCGADVVAGDVVIGLPSSGLHSNGFSLVRHVVEHHKLRYDMPSPFDQRLTLGQELLIPTEIYVKSVLPAVRAGKVKSFAHITGGGLVENIPRVLPQGLGVHLDASKWFMPPVFGWLQHMGRISDHEMSRTFNCGLGGVLIVGQGDVTDVMTILSDNGGRPGVVGTVVKVQDDAENVHIDHLASSLHASWPRPRVPEQRKRVAVLISGSGTNLQALIDHTQDKSKRSAAEIVLVISNVPDVAGLTRAKKAGIKTVVIDHKGYKSRAEFDAAVHEVLVQHRIELVCLAGFMRILTGEFVNKWVGRMLNIHPSLLPSFKGAHAQKLAIEARVQISGCTVHFVAEEVDAGAIIVQESVPVYPGDTIDMLAERIKTAEHVAFPAALEMVASERARLGADGKLVWAW
ncbi:hypothetical protein BsWGS_26605 [Bradybaena similaris]